MEKQYFNIMEAWFMKCDTPPTEGLKRALLGWESVVNYAYQDGYEAGIETAMARVEPINKGGGVV